jgi:hypothetical protein
MADEGVPSLDDAGPLVAAADPVQGGGTGTGDGGSPAAVQDYSLDSTRKRIAFFLLFIMAGIVALVAIVSLIYSAGCWLNGSRCTQAEGALTLLNTGISPMFTAMVGLVGSVVGFYFGSKAAT